MRLEIFFLIIRAQLEKRHVKERIGFIGLRILTFIKTHKFQIEWERLNNYNL